MQRLIRLDPPLLCLATRFGNTPQEIWRTRSASHDCEGGAIALRYLWKQQSQRKGYVMDVYVYKKDARGHLLAPAVTNFHAEIRTTRSSTPLHAESARAIAKKLKNYLTEARRDASGEDIFVHFSAPSDVRWRPGAPYPEMGGDPFLAEDKNAFYAAFFAR